MVSFTYASRPIFCAQNIFFYSFIWYIALYRFNDITVCRTKKQTLRYHYVIRPTTDPFSYNKLKINVRLLAILISNFKMLFHYDAFIDREVETGYIAVKVRIVLKMYKFIVRMRRNNK